MIASERKMLLRTSEASEVLINKHALFYAHKKLYKIQLDSK